MNKVAFRFFDPIIYALHAIAAHWKKIVLLDLFFVISAYCSEWLITNLKLLSLSNQAGHVEKGINGLFFGLLPQFDQYGQATKNINGGFILIGFVLIIALIDVLVTFWALPTYARISLRIYDGNSFGFNDIVSSLHYMPPVARAWGFFVLFSIFWAAVFFGLVLTRSFFTPFLGEKNFVILLGVIAGLAILSNLWLFFRTLLSTFFIVDKNYGAKKSLVSSYRLTKNKLWLLVGVDFVILVIAALLLLPLAACIIALPILFKGMNRYTYQIIMEVGKLIFMMLYGWMTVLANGYIYRKLSESQELQKVQGQL